MKNINKLFLVLAGLVSVFFIIVSPIMTNNVEAATMPCLVDGVYEQTYFDWGSECIGGSNIITIVFVLYNWISLGVLIVVAIGIIIGAIQYTSAQGSAEQAKAGMKRIGSALLALGLYFIMWALLNFLVPGGMLNDNGKIDENKLSHISSNIDMKELNGVN